MAKQRVQVQDLPDAPSLQPTVLQRGREAIVTRQAGRNSLLDLADTLKQVNPALKTYGAIQDLDYENFQKELQRLSPEERRKLVTQERDEMDKLVRKNVIPFMGNAWNWKRKSRAIGALMHDEFQQVLQENLDDPKWADQSVDEIVQMTREALEDGAPILKTDTYAREGFQEAINPTVNAYKLKYDKIKDDAERLRIKDATQSQIHRITSMGVSSEGAKEIEEIWQSIEGSLTPKQLENIIEHVALTHAASGNTKAAKEFARFAAGHLKMGTSLMGDPNTKQDDTFGQYTDKVSALMETIDRADKARGDEDAREARKILAGKATEASQLAFKLSQEGEFRVDPDDPNSALITDATELYNYLYAKHKHIGDQNAFVGAGLPDTIRNSIKGAQIPGENVSSLQSQFTQQYPQAVRESLELAENYASAQSASFKEDLSKEDAIENLLAYVTKKEALKSIHYNTPFENKRREIASGTFTTVNGESITKEFDYGKTAQYLKEWSDKYAEEYTEAIIKLNDDTKNIQETLLVKPSVVTEGSDSEDQKAFTQPTTNIGDLSGSGLGVMGDWENLEEAIIERNKENAKEAIGELRSEGELLNAYNTLQGSKKVTISTSIESFDFLMPSTIKQKNTAARKLMIAMASDGVFQKGDRAILDGVVQYNVGGGQTVSVPLDYKILQEAQKFYPLITRERAQRASDANGKEYNKADEDYIKKVIAKISGVEKDAVTENDINTFLKNQLEAYNKWPF